MSIGGGVGGGSSSTYSKATSSTPWSGIASELAGTLKTSLSNLANGSNVSNWIKTLTASSKQATKEGTTNIREAFGASGMGLSTGLAKSIGDFQTNQTTALNENISQVEQQNVSNQLSALQEIISLASGTGSQTGANWGSNFGWNFDASFKHKA